MADKPTQLILAALGRAVAEPGGAPLFGSRSTPGLFPGNAAGKQAAQRARDEGYLQVIRTETRGPSAVEWCAATEKGLAYLLSQSSPRQVLEDLVRALEAREAQTGELLSAARQMQVSLEGIKANAEKVLRHVRGAGTNGNVDAENWKDAVLAYLERREASGAAEDCPLPELYRQALQAHPELTIGHFHDGLRQFHAGGHVYLHPWTGPLYEIPEPPYALLVGHEIAYYASPRRAA